MQATDLVKPVTAEEILAEFADLIPAPAKAEKTPCGVCGGEGTVLVDPNDVRKGETTCGGCGGEGEL